LWSGEIIALYVVGSFLGLFGQLPQLHQECPVSSLSPSPFEDLYDDRPTVEAILIAKKISA
jgi:hypothetical protein